jgi:hypothetical protein
MSFSALKNFINKNDKLIIGRASKEEREKDIKNKQVFF